MARGPSELPFEPVTWAEKPSLDDVRGAVEAFFAAIAEGNAPRAFSRVPHHESSKPYMTVPSAATIKAAVTLMRKVLLDHGLIAKEDKTWASRLRFAEVVPATEYAWYARLSLDDKVLPVAGLFNAIKDAAGRWLVAFSMLRQPR